MKSPGDSQRSKRPAHPDWAALPDEDLLRVRLKDLRVSLSGTWLEDCLRDLSDELGARNIAVRPHAWISDEWFSPSNTSGISLPFYLTHPRLARLERKMMLGVEGGTRRECMQLLRHEAGHVVQHAYALHRKRRWQAVFGLSSIPYPDHYRPDPTSKDYVQHLRRWYAQCHPDEDFAETFAIWLTPRSAWRKRYADWPAINKLLYVDELMGEIAGARPLPMKRIQVDPIDTMTKTLDEHYREKLEHYAVDAPTALDRGLRRIFSDDPCYNGAPSAAVFIQRNRGEIRRLVAKSTGDPPLSLEAALDDMVDRCHVLKLRAPGSQRQMRLDLTMLLTNKALRSLYGSSRRQWFAV